MPPKGRGARTDVSGRSVSYGVLERKPLRLQASSKAPFVSKPGALFKRRNWDVSSKLAFEVGPPLVVHSEEEWGTRTLATMPRSPQATPPLGAKRPLRSELPRDGLPAIGPGMIGGACRPVTPNSIWRAQTLETLKDSRRPLSRPLSEQLLQRPAHALAERPVSQPSPGLGARSSRSAELTAELARLSSDAGFEVNRRPSRQGTMSALEAWAFGRSEGGSLDFGFEPEGGVLGASPSKGSTAPALPPLPPREPEGSVTSSGSFGVVGTPVGRTKSEARRRASGLRRLSCVLPEAEEVIHRLECVASGGDVEFSPKERQRLKATWQRFRHPDSHDVHKDDLSDIVRHLGFMHTEDDKVRAIADQCSAFASLEWDDFMDFMQRFSRFEHDRFKEVFDEFDEDGNGVLDREEIVKFLLHLGFTPLRKTLREAMDAVDLNSDNQLQFEEVVLLMHLYRQSEGFSQEEVQQFNKVFAETQRLTRQNTVVGEGVVEDLAPERLQLLLTKFFGPVHAEAAHSLAQEFVSRAQASATDGADQGPPLGLHVNEALLWARRLRDKEIESFRKAFEEADSSRDGIVDFEELKRMLTKLGFTLTDAVIDEMICKAKEQGDWHELANDHELDYDAFVHFMRVLHERDGFSDKEMDEVHAVFKKFDEDGSGDIDTIELGDILHYLGFQTKLEEVMVVLSRVDYNNNGTLGFREFVRFMRLHRENQLKTVRDVFEEHLPKQEGPGVRELDEAGARIALAQLAVGDQAAMTGLQQTQSSHEDSDINMAIRLHELEVEPPVSFSQFVELAEEVRARRVRELRKRAGFSGQELARFQAVFNQHDAKQKGYLDTEEATRFVINLGFPLQTVEDQQSLVKQLGAAKEAAGANGVEIEEGQVVFWVAVQLLRFLYRRDDRVTLHQVARAAEQCNFQAAEVADFQEVFLNWHQTDMGKYSAVGSGSEQRQDSDETKFLSRSSLLRLLRSLGLKVEGPDRASLDKKVAELTHDVGNVVFADFLRLMRWMLDSDFCNINKAAPSTPTARS